MFDTNQTGTIDMNEFGRLFAYIQQWKAMFENFDRDRLDDDHVVDDHDVHDDHDDDNHDDHIVDDDEFELTSYWLTSRSGRQCLTTLASRAITLAPSEALYTKGYFSSLYGVGGEISYSPKFVIYFNGHIYDDG